MYARSPAKAVAKRKARRLFAESRTVWRERETSSAVQPATFRDLETSTGNLLLYSRISVSVTTSAMSS